MRRFLSALILMGPLLVMAEPLTLPETLEAVTQSPQYLSMKAGTEASEAAVGLSRSWPEPRLGLSVQPLPIETRLGPQQGALNLQQPLPWPGLLETRTRSALANAESARYGLQQGQRRLRLVAGRAWLKLWETEREIRALQELLEWNTDQRTSLDARYEAGLGSAGAHLRARLGEQQAELRLAEARDRLPGLRTALARAIGRQDLQGFDLPAELDKPQALPDTLRMDHNPSWLQSRSILEHQSREEELSRLDNRPELGLGLSWIFTGEAEMPVDDSGRDALVLSLNLRLPLWKQANRARLAVAGRRRAGAAADSRDTELSLGSSWQQARDSYRSARRDEELLLDELLPLAKTLLEATQEEYRGGLARFDEVAAAAMEYTRLQLDHDRSLARLWSAALELQELARPAEPAKMGE